MGKLVLVRHGRSTWNVLGLWTGWTDVELDPSGIEDSKKMALLLSAFHFDKAYTSKLKRTRQTLDIILDELGIKDLERENSEALNERHYGIYQGKNKWEIKKEVGEETFQKIRRGWDYPIPEGETMEEVYNRVVPFFKEKVLPELKEGKNILISASGNSLRALIKYLDNLSVDEFMDLEFGIGEIYIYDFDTNGKIISKTLKGENPNKGSV